MQTQKLLLAGSHAGSTAIAVIEEIKKRNLNWEIHWLGMEYKGLNELGVIFHNLNSGKIENKFTKNTVKSLFRIPLSFIRGQKIIKEINPDLVLSFGSAAGAIASFWANAMGKTVIIHEQTATAGRANIFSSYFSKKVLVARSSSSSFFNKNKIEVVGNPINSVIVKNSSNKPNSRVKSILITGGSRGSVWINNAIKPILPQLLKRYFVMHQVGEANTSEFSDIKDERYINFGQIAPTEMAEVLSKADVVISRSGANTVSELIALKKPSILIPIPWTYNDEATENAKYMEKLGLARILLQKDLTAQKLLAEIEKLIADYSYILAGTENLQSPDIHAAEKVVDILSEHLDTYKVEPLK